MKQPDVLLYVYYIDIYTYLHPHIHTYTHTYMLYYINTYTIYIYIRLIDVGKITNLCRHRRRVYIYTIPIYTYIPII